MTSYGSILEATTAIRTTTIPDHGRRVYYRGYLIHGEIPGVCYVIYGRNEFGQVMELGATRTFQVRHAMGGFAPGANGERDAGARPQARLIRPVVHAGGRVTPDPPQCRTSHRSASFTAGSWT